MVLQKAINYDKNRGGAYMENQMETTKEFALETVISTTVQIPGVKVNRNKFLAEVFATENISIQDVLDQGPVGAGFSSEKLSSIASKLILKRTGQSSAASFLTGIPGGLAMAATIPADVMQFFGMALRLAQELSYLYGAQDLWQGGQIDDERVRSQLIMYCGVMFGVSGAASGVRVLSTQIAKTTLKKLPQKALTKTFWYPIVKQIGKAIGIKVTKSTVAKGFSKAIPVIGGVISGSLNFASMMPMANRLHEALDKASFDYSEEELNADIEIIESISEDTVTDVNESEKDIGDVKEKVTQGIKSVGTSVSSFFTKRNDKENTTDVEPTVLTDDIIVSIEKLSKLKDMGAITQEEFGAKKSELLAKI